jgi:3-oxoacyl-[acyl-carrier protein] reductase
MKLGITGKVAIVTAASGGLGSAIAHGLAAEGVRVVVFSRSQAALEALASDIEKEHGVRSLAVVGDVLARQLSTDQVVKSLHWRSRVRDSA